MSCLVEERCRIYWFLGDCFLKAPTRKLLDVWQSLHRQDVEFDLMALQQDYIRCVAGIKEGYGLIPPYESLYRPDTFPTEIRAAVSSYFDAAGIDADSVCAQSPDFLSSEFRLLSLLAYHQHQAEIADDAEQSLMFENLQQEFLQHHLRVWLPEYCQKLAEAGKDGFYGQLAIYMQAFVAEIA